MEIRILEIDFDASVLRINGKTFDRPIIVTLPGPEDWPLVIMLNDDKSTGSLNEFCELKVTYANSKL